LQPEVQKIIDEVSENTGIPSKIIEKAWKSQFQVVRDIISKSHETEYYPVVYLRYFGKFIPQKEYIKAKKKYGYKKNERDNGGLAELSDTKSDNREGGTAES
jgi:hypothetical protein